MKNRDIEALKSMMNPDVLEDVETLDDEVEKLLNFPQGSIVGYEYYYAGEKSSKENGQSKAARRIRSRLKMVIWNCEPL
jgi:hypothetical protein